MASETLKGMAVTSMGGCRRQRVWKLRSSTRSLGAISIFLYLAPNDVHEIYQHFTY
jgi:hypothetical protein